MSSSRRQVVTETRWDDRGTLAEFQVVVVTGGGGGGRGKGLGPAGKGVRRGEGRAVKGTETGGEVMRNSVPAPQSLPRTALWLSSGSPQYSHFALDNTSAAISRLWPPSTGIQTPSTTRVCAHPRRQHSGPEEVGPLRAPPHSRREAGLRRRKTPPLPRSRPER